ncbi:hypothetical protein [Halomarina pelagica]|uniref:hypothetical protein n=1 Tax=Halomarina pelagica TaxID=2961599 RepID=UPI0020C43930|nr:hypothetical protein [Halomarina sp. BND7]
MVYPTRIIADALRKGVSGLGIEERGSVDPRVALSSKDEVPLSRDMRISRAKVSFDVSETEPGSVNCRTVVGLP